MVSCQPILINRIVVFHKDCCFYTKRQNILTSRSIFRYNQRLCKFNYMVHSKRFVQFKQLSFGFSLDRQMDETIWYTPNTKYIEIAVLHKTEKFIKTNSHQLTTFIQKWMEIFCCRFFSPVLNVDHFHKCFFSQ